VKTQSLAKSEITKPQKKKKIILIEKLGQIEQIRQIKHSNANISVIIIRLICLIFCLAFWYGIYKLFRLLIF